MKSYQGGHQRSRSSVKVAVDQKRRGMACRVALPGHKLGLDQPTAGSPGRGGLIVERPETPNDPRLHH